MIRIARLNGDKVDGFRVMRHNGVGARSCNQARGDLAQVFGSAQVVALRRASVPSLCDASFASANWYVKERPRSCLSRRERGRESLGIATPLS